jgi:hypothetical protein
VRGYGVGMLSSNRRSKFSREFLAVSPQTLAFGPTDSPAGLAARICEKFQAWSDGDIKTVFSQDAFGSREMRTGTVDISLS